MLDRMPLSGTVRKSDERLRDMTEDQARAFVETLRRFNMCQEGEGISTNRWTFARAFSPKVANGAGGWDWQCFDGSFDPFDKSNMMDW